MTPVSLPAFVADGATFDLTWKIGIGLGAGRDTMVIVQPFGPPYAQLVLPLPLLVTAKQVTVEAALTGMPATANTFTVRFAAFVAPFSWSGLGADETGGTQG
jgi:hypothetical protein